MIDDSTEADETVVNIETAGQSWGLFVESMILKEDRRDRSVLSSEYRVRRLRIGTEIAVSESHIRRR